jgi:murein L,D-transpeptidase YcbB/YkuD
MKKFVLILILLAFIGCKKDKPDPVPIPKAVKEKYKKERKGLAIDSVSLMENPDSLLVLFYRMNSFETVWSHPETRKALIYMFAKSDVEEGLDPKDYYVRKLQLFEDRMALLSEKQKIEYDMLLTKAMRRYLRHLSRGKIYPGSLYRSWDFKKNIIDINGLLSGGISGDSLSAVIARARPSHITYKKLLSALQIINRFPDDSKIRRIDTIMTIKRRDTVDCLVDIKKRLIYWKDMAPQDSLSNIYDRKTYVAMKKFQKRHGLYPDGVIEKRAIRELNYTRDQRKGQIIANLERWRWFPKHMGNHYIIINIPEYMLSIVKDNDTIEQKRIVVGKPDRRTPILSSTFSNIIFNPTWTVPPTILNKDLTPDATNDRGYFARREIAIYNQKGQPVSPEDWNPARAKSYRYIQRPGDHNSLGNVKFNFPNRFTVYLHDTNHRELFGVRYRSLSSGCVRVEDPLPLAAYMLNDTVNWSMDKIKEVVSTKKTTSVNLKEKINIHQLYWTAWSEDGELIFRPDIYELDAGLYKVLRK